jgi:hypothetical protein
VCDTPMRPGANPLETMMSVQLSLVLRSTVQPPVHPLVLSETKEGCVLHKIVPHARILVLIVPSVCKLL